ncbi:MAG: hypothetical protein IJB41_04505 [Clostridia bacterium]|nr:hypothetical protein [Clostridia bacterium]
MSGIGFEINERYERLEPSGALLRRTEKMMDAAAHRRDPQGRKLRQACAAIAIVCIVLGIAAGALVFAQRDTADRVTPLSNGSNGGDSGTGMNGAAVGSTLSEPVAGSSVAAVMPTDFLADGEEPVGSTISEPEGSAGVVPTKVPAASTMSEPTRAPVDSTMSEPTRAPADSTMSEPTKAPADSTMSEPGMVVVFNQNSGTYYHNSKDCPEFGDRTVTTWAPIEWAKDVFHYEACPVCFEVSAGGFFAHENGLYFHADRSCGGLSNAEQISRKEAEARGQYACPNCLGVYVQKGGSYYHTVPTCRRMTKARIVSVSKAKSVGMEACPDCTGAYYDTDVYYYIEGSKNYHRDESCRGMQGAVRITRKAAVSKGLIACGACVDAPAQEETRSEAYCYYAAGGSDYHMDKHCGGMADAKRCSLEAALEMGLTACEACVPGAIEAVIDIESEFPMVIEEDGLVLTIESAEATTYDLCVDISVRSKREAPVYIAVEAEVITPEDNGEENVNDEIGYSVESHVALIVDGEGRGAPVLYRIDPDTDTMWAGGFSVDCVRRRTEGAFRVIVKLYAFEAAERSENGAADWGEQEEELLADVTSVWAGDYQWPVFIRAEGGMSYINRPEYVQTYEALKEAGLRSYDAHMRALAESGLMKSVARIGKEIELYRQEDVEEVALGGLEAKLPGRSVAIDEMYISPVSFEAKYKVVLEDTPYREMLEADWQNPLYWEKILFYLMDGEGNYIYTPLETGRDAYGATIRRHGKSEIVPFEAEGGLLGFEVWLRNRIDMDKMPETIVFAPFRDGTYGKYEGNHQRRFEQLYKDTPEEECFTITLKAESISLGSRAVKIAYAAMNDGMFRASDMDPEDGLLHVEYHVYSKERIDLEMKYGMDLAYFAVDPNGRPMDEPGNGFSEAEQSDGIWKAELNSYILLENNEMPEYIVFVPYEGTQMALAGEEKTQTKQTRMLEVSAGECFVLLASDLYSPRPLTEKMLARIQQAQER